MGSRLLLSMLLLLLPLTATAWPPWRDHKSVNIINELAAGPPLSVHCRSADDDLGGHTLLPLETYGFGFYPNFGGTTEFWCEFHWGSRWQRFTVWKDTGPFPGEKSRDRPCEQCVYVVRSDAFLRGEGPNGPFKPVASWK